LALSSYKNELHDSFVHYNGPEFWKCWRFKFESNNNCDEVDGCVDDQVVADKFACHFSKSYTCNNQQHAAVLQAKYLNKRVGYSGASLLTLMYARGWIKTPPGL